MTPPPLARALPIRVPVVPGEGLDSWLEALARRNGLSIGRLLPALGWQVPHTSSGLLLGIPAPVLRRIERQAGLPPGRLNDAVLDRYLALGTVRRDGSRYCPRCLAERDGRWLLAWRLPWVFACARHRVLLCDSCPGCGKTPRAYAGTGAGRTPAASCPNPVTLRMWCAADLRAVPAQRLASGGRLLAAQHWIHTALASAADSAADTREAVAAVQMLTDLDVVAGWLLRQSSARDFARFGLRVRDAWRAWAAQPAANSAALGCSAPADAGLTGAAAAQAVTLLTGDDQDAIGRMRPMLRHEPAHWPVRPAGFTQHQWKQLSSPARGRFLQALGPSLTAVERIRHRSSAPLPRLPADSAELLAVRARKIPQMLWPDWAIRLTPAEGFLPAPFRATIAACLLLPGNPARTIRGVLTALHAYRSSVAVSQIIRALGEQGHDSVLAAVCHLAEYLDTCGSLIDYQRRRDTISPEMIIPGEWQDLCLEAGAHPGEARRLLDARRHLYQLLTGADLGDPRHTLAFRSAGDRRRHHEFTDTLTTPLRAALHDHATRYLESLGIAEPLTWQPPASCCAHLTLPGRDPDDIDLQAVGQLAIAEGLPVGTVAERLGTSSGHIRLALEQVPRPARQWGKAAAPIVRQWQNRARRVLTREFFQREYVQAGKTLRQLEAETRFPRKFLAERAREHGITVAGAFDPAPIDPAWLREQYLTRRRSYTDIAAELGVQDVTVIAAARRHHMPSRPPGVHSRPEMLAKLSNDVPRDIRRAVEGGLNGWHRLQRFQTAMTFPTIEAAAAHLGTHQSALVHQFKRLEHDIGAKLYHRSTLRQPMRPTPRGAVLLRALHRPDVQALAAANGQRSGVTSSGV
ncbi:MAG TPA: TniQ family protein [Streptosporangiaceae bacterium]